MSDLHVYVADKLRQSIKECRQTVAMQILFKSAAIDLHSWFYEKINQKFDLRENDIGQITFGHGIWVLSSEPARGVVFINDGLTDVIVIDKKFDLGFVILCAHESSTKIINYFRSCDFCDELEPLKYHENIKRFMIDLDYFYDYIIC